MKTPLSLLITTPITAFDSSELICLLQGLCDNGSSDENNPPASRRIRRAKRSRTNHDGDKDNISLLSMHPSKNGKSTIVSLVGPYSDVEKIKLSFADPISGSMNGKGMVGSYLPAGQDAEVLVSLVEESELRLPKIQSRRRSSNTLPSSRKSEGGAITSKTAPSIQVETAGHNTTTVDEEQDQKTTNNPLPPTLLHTPLPKILDSLGMEIIPLTAAFKRFVGERNARQGRGKKPPLAVGTGGGGYASTHTKKVTKASEETLSLREVTMAFRSMGHENISFAEIKRVWYSGGGSSESAGFGDVVKLYYALCFGKGEMKNTLKAEDFEVADEEDEGDRKIGDNLPAPPQERNMISTLPLGRKTRENDRHFGSRMARVDKLQRDVEDRNAEIKWKTEILEKVAASDSVGLGMVEKAVNGVGNDDAISGDGASAPATRDNPEDIQHERITALKRTLHNKYHADSVGGSETEKVFAEFDMYGAGANPRVLWSDAEVIFKVLGWMDDDGGNGWNVWGLGCKDWIEEWRDENTEDDEVDSGEVLTLNIFKKMKNSIEEEANEIISNYETELTTSIVRETLFSIVDNCVSVGEVRPVIESVLTGVIDHAVASISNFCKSVLDDIVTEILPVTDEAEENHSLSVSSGELSSLGSSSLEADKGPEEESISVSSGFLSSLESSDTSCSRIQINLTKDSSDNGDDETISVSSGDMSSLGPSDSEHESEGDSMSVSSGVMSSLGPSTDAEDGSLSVSSAAMSSLSSSVALQAPII